MNAHTKEREEENTCPACEMPRSEWKEAKGVQKNGKTYCCKGCAEGTGCECD